MDLSFISAVVVLFLVIDPLGNIPLFVSLLGNVAPGRRTWIVFREWLIALALLLGFVFAGEGVLRLFGLSDPSLNIAGGVILFLIALGMIFRPGIGAFAGLPEGEPLVVPLAVPAIAGPGTMATVILLASRAPDRVLEWTAAVAIAMLASLAVLLFAERLSRRVDKRALAAIERLFGLILTAFAVEMVLRGIAGFVRQLG
ncbi:MAG: MarC family protein [Betaproteobacteria bacterium]|jgi:MarC family membrane protein|nr:MarC family protein [Betaproteobacteria bacterium]